MFFSVIKLKHNLISNKVIVPNLGMKKCLLKIEHLLPEIQ